jgi:16S rRNA (guanine966-N2)-methyltransferase
VTRIIGGEARGRRLRTPAGDATRPTADRVREALFSAIESRLGTFAGRSFLDLYAGSGAVGLEARSRGADRVLLVEQDRATARLLESNARDLGLDGTQVRTGRVERVVGAPHTTEGFDVAFLDAPYDVPTADLDDVLTALAKGDWLADGALVVVERASRGESWTWPAGYEPLQSRRYGETMLWYGRLAVAGE